jgi:hypothetical protein
VRRHHFEEETLLRKLFTGAVIASASLAIAGGAIAQTTNSDGSATLDATLSPAKSGTAKKPRSVSLRANLVVAKPGTTVEVIELKVSKKLKFSGKGFKKCNAEDLEFGGTAACPSGSKAGPRGTATAVIEPGGAPLDFEVFPFVEDANTFLFYLNGINGNGVQAVVKGEITSKGRKMRITIPLALRQPAAGLDATLTGIDQTFVGKSGRNAIVSSIGCKNRKHKVTGTLEFATRFNGTPGPAAEALAENVRCTK